MINFNVYKVRTHRSSLELGLLYAHVDHRMSGKTNPPNSLPLGTLRKLSIYKIGKYGYLLSMWQVMQVISRIEMANESPW